MVRVLIALTRGKSAPALEFAGASAVVYGVFQHSHWVAWVVAGIALSLKAMEVDLKRSPKS